MRWTEEQARAIEARGGNLLLSAAAGSGKTTVLVERVLRLILEDGAEVDRMLVVTFTRAAASDMRAKLSRKLAERASAGDARCREQMLRLERASITTLHAFCSDFLRTHFEAAGVDPAFRVLDDAVQRQLMDEALDEALEEAYAAGGEALEALDYGRGPKTVRELTEALCRKLEERPDPEEWMERIAGGTDALISEWMNELLRGAKRALTQAKLCCEQARALPGCPPNYAAAIEKDLARIDGMLEIDEYDPMYRELSEFKAASAASGRRGGPVDEEAVDAVKKLRDKAKKLLAGAKLLDHPAAQAIEDARAQAPQIAELGRLARAVTERFEEKKDERSGLTYSDLERRTLIALKDDSVARELRARFDYVFIDEYQDTSDVQEAIVSRLCRTDNRFMVGDVKQSIYRFRMAEPRLFIEKYKRYQTGDGGTLLPLTRNFRSKPEILSFVNMIFERAMTGGDSEIEYDALARLNPGVDDAEPGAPVEIHLIQKAEPEADTDEALADLKDAEREGLFIARTIRRMRETDPTLSFRDFAILTRNKSNAFTPMMPMLLAEGIPAYADGATGYFESVEVLLTLSMLKLIANQRSDVELIAVLHSPVAGLTAGELAEIRIAGKEIPFVDAARRYAYGTERREPGGEGGEAPLPDNRLAAKLRAFFGLLDSWRLRSGATGLGELVRAVLDESGFYVYAGALPGGGQRQANLDRLVADAGSFDDGVSGSIVRFLKHTERMKEKGDGDAAHLLGENDDVVRMMTIHRSKGLEFRVVFGAMLSRKYRGARTELFSSDRELGIGVGYFDPKLRTKRKTLAQSAIAERAQREDAAEEMRILYVLLTRAQERLILVGSVRSAEKSAQEWQALSGATGGATSHLDLIMAARTAAENAHAPLHSVVTVHGINELSGDGPMLSEPRAVFDGILAEPEKYADEELEAELAWRYPSDLGTQKPLKLTVSGLLREVEGPSELPTLMQRPEFLSEESAKRMTGAERGTAYHRMMQLMDLSVLAGKEGRALTEAIRNQMEDFRARRLITEVQHEAVRPSRLAAFLSGETGKRLMAAKELHREWSFNVMLRAGEVLEDSGRFADEELLVQGTIDCCFEEAGGWVLLDYKTDRSDDPEALRGHYGKQLEVYALALERITGLPVKERLLCLLGTNTVLPC